MRSRGPAAKLAPARTPATFEENIMEQVTLYSSQACGYCAMAKRLLHSKGVQAVEIDITSDPQQRAEMTARTGKRTVPQIFIGAQHVGGYTDLAALEKEGKLDALLEHSSAGKAAV
jgi:glutaredoxin 3